MNGTEGLLREPAIQAVGWALLHFVWQGALVGSLAAIALRLLRHGAADLRYLVATIGLVMMATLPLVTGAQAWSAARLEWSSVAPGHETAPSTPVGGAASVSGSNVPADASADCTGGDACSSRPFGAGRFERWLPGLVLVWMTGVALFALRLAGGWLRIHRMRTRGLDADPAVLAIVHRLARRLHVSRPIVLLRSPAVDVPTVIGWLKPVVLLPMSALAGLTPQQLEAVLAHELAHIRRHDYLVNLLQSVVETLLFYHPAVWWLSRRIRVEREHCCDDLAVSLCGDPIVYARALADLEDLRDAGALAMAANGGALLARVRRLLAGPATHAGRGPAWLAASTAFLLMVAIVGGPVGRQSVAAANLVADDGRPISLASAIGAMLGSMEDPMGQLPVPPPPPEPPEAPLPPISETSGAHQPPAPPPPPPPPPDVDIDLSRQGSSGTITWSRDGQKVTVNYRGSFALNDTDTDIVRMSPNGYLKIADGGWLGGRSVEFTADGSGNITRRFMDGSRERPFEPDGREWLARLLPTFVRQSAFGAKERVARFLKTGGVDAVLKEISLIESDYAKKVYFTHLIDQASLDSAAARRMFAQAGREIDSDYELATTLIAGSRLLSDDGSRKAYFDAARTIESDYEMRRAYMAALERGPVSPAVLTDLLDAARSLDSDYEAATLLLEVVKRHPIEGAARASFFSAVGTLGSSYEKGRVLQSLLRRSDLSAETLAAAIGAAGTVDSDYETAQVLVAAARAHEITGAARDAYVRAADRLGDYERNRALAALARTSR